MSVLPAGAGARILLDINPRVFSIDNPGATIHNAGMTQPEQICPDCGAAFDVADNYCRQCGMYLAALRAVATVEPAARAIEPVRTGMPAPVRKAATALAVGTALQVAVGLTGKYLARHAARQAVSAVRPAKVTPRRAVARQAEANPAVVEEPLDAATAVSETLIIQRVWMRRGR